MYASQLIGEVAADLFDTGYDRWDEDYHLSSLNSAERQLVFLKPTSYVITAVYRLVAGPAQSLPDGSGSYLSPTGVTHPAAIELVGITRNMGTDGLVAGASIHPVDPKDMDELCPGWRAVTAVATVQNYMFNKDDRTVFDVYPKQPSASMGWIEVVYSAVPPEIASVGGSYDVDINLPDEYTEPLKQYMKYRAYDMDAGVSEYSADRALAHLNHFLTQIGRKDLVEQRYPRRKHGNTDQQLQK